MFKCISNTATRDSNTEETKEFDTVRDWDRLPETIANSDNCLVEVNLERFQVIDVGLSCISNCSRLEILHIVKTPEYTNIGAITVAEH
ncbi:hypothetical protein L2E82_02780 [Cichorium intybus]|uniref:Uncharacterized protein n=1 Tax=Cichorium intybus TaxID=13427 RepID=A0ACB9H4R4_CICIN|nr:hypothetical protein L2E82_02780 [Cichorium intybus]